MNLTVTGKVYLGLRNKYFAYLDTYKSLNGGSTEGATSFADFYFLMTYTSKYQDPRTLASLGQK